MDNNYSDELFILGIKIISAIHSGYCKITCSDCDESRKLSLGCNDNLDRPIYNLDDNEFYCCPIRFITQQVYDWYDEYNYHQTFQGTAPGYNNNTKRYWDSVKLYKMYLNKYEELRDSKPDKSNNEAFSNLKSGLIQRKKLNDKNNIR